VTSLDEILHILHRAIGRVDFFVVRDVVSHVNLDNMLVWAFKAGRPVYDSDEIECMLGGDSRRLTWGLSNLDADRID
jgi:hypothetical protein